MLDLVPYDMMKAILTHLTQPLAYERWFKKEMKAKICRDAVWRQKLVAHVQEIPRRYCGTEYNWNKRIYD